jgi:glycosyltransferase involved in cell wall biosynthesis
MSSVDVIIPCYNYARFLRECVASVVTQGGVDLRLLIIDDASDDDTLEVGRALARDDGRIRYRRHSANHGHIATYNEGLEWAAGDYVLLLSADDGLTPGALARASRVMDAHAEIGLTCGRQIVFESTWPEMPSASEYSWRMLSSAEFLETASASGQNPVATPTAVVRTALQKAVGGYRKELPHTADLELWLRLAARGAVGVLDTAQAVKRSHDRNMQHAFLGPTLPDLMQRHAAFETFFGEHCDRFDVNPLRLLASCSIATEAFWAASHAFDRHDAGLCERLLALASSLDPTLAGRPEWSRLKWKRRFGTRFWRATRSLVGQLRGGSAGVPAR